eukprot:g10029.t1
MTNPSPNQAADCQGIARKRRKRNMQGDKINDRDFDIRRSYDSVRPGIFHYLASKQTSPPVLWKVCWCSCKVFQDEYFGPDRVNANPEAAVHELDLGAILLLNRMQAKARIRAEYDPLLDAFVGTLFITPVPLPELTKANIDRLGHGSPGKKHQRRRRSWSSSSGSSSGSILNLHRAIALQPMSKQGLMKLLQALCILTAQVVGLQPEEEYTISVSPHGDSVFDGMGLPLQASQGTLKMGEMPGVFLAPQPPNPSLWTSSCSDRFLPQDIPVVFPFLQRQPPRQMYRKVDPGAQMQAFACSISSTDELGDFLTFFFSPGKAPVVLLLFLELTCVGNDLGARCATERPASRARFLNAASFSALTAFAAPSSAPYAALGEVRQSTILVSVHSLLDQEPVAGHQVEVWEIPSTRWIHGRSLQPPARRVGTALTDAHGRSLLILPEEQTGQEARDEKGYVAVIANPKTGEILLGDLLRLGPPSPRFVTESEALAASLRLYVTTDRAVYVGTLVLQFLHGNIEKERTRIHQHLHKLPSVAMTAAMTPEVWDQLKHLREDREKLKEAAERALQDGDEGGFEFQNMLAKIEGKYGSQPPLPGAKNEPQALALPKKDIPLPPPPAVPAVPPPGFPLPKLPGIGMPGFGNIPPGVAASIPAGVAANLPPGIANIPPGVASALGKMQAVPGAPPVPGFPPGLMGVRPPVVPGMVPPVPPLPGQPVNLTQQQAMEYEETKARDTALEPEVIELVHYFKISDRHARMLNEQLKRRNNTYEEDIASLYEILKGAKNPGARDLLMVSIRWMERGVFRGTLTPNPAVEKLAEVLECRDDPDADLRKISEHLAASNKPSSLAWDPSVLLAAISTRRRQTQSRPKAAEAGPQLDAVPAEIGGIGAAGVDEVEAAVVVGTVAVQTTVLVQTTRAVTVVVEIALVSKLMAGAATAEAAAAGEVAMTVPRKIMQVRATEQTATRSRLERPGQEEVCSIHLWPLSVMGMFTANITVPQNASLGRLPAVSMYWAGKMIQVPESCSAWRQIRSQMQTPAVSVQGTSFLDILIADPRPPSAVLTLGAPQFLLPSKSLTINATLQTYTGIPLQNHELQDGCVQLVKHGPSKRNENPMPLSTSTSSEADEESTELLGKTDSLGELRIGGDLPWVPNLGDEITVKVKARGPTGEMLTKSHKLPVRIGPWDITLRRNFDQKAEAYVEQRHVAEAWKQDVSGGHQQTCTMPMDRYQARNSLCGPPLRRFAHHAH